MNLKCLRTLDLTYQTQELWSQRIYVKILKSEFALPFHNEKLTVFLETKFSTLF